MVNGSLAIALQLAEECTDEQVTSSFESLLISAVHDGEPQKTLAEIYHILIAFSGSSYLDPLNTIPLLLPCDDLDARNIISLIGECGPAKEVVMTVQEAAERLELNLQGETDEDEENENRKEDALSLHKQNSPIAQLLILIDLYASAIPRIKLRRTSASDTLQPLFEELKNLAHLACSHVGQESNCDILSSISKLVLSVQSWVTSNVPRESKEEVGSCKAILTDCLDQSLLVCGRGMDTQVAQRTLEKYYPRLALRSASPASKGKGESAIMEWLKAYDSLGFQFAILERGASASDLIFYAYRPPIKIDIDRLLSFLLPALISSIQANMFLNESLAVLTAYLHIWQTESHGRNLSHDVTVPLCEILPAVASAHADPSVRHQTFRVLALLLSTTDPRLRFQHLIEYTQDAHYPQLRVASVNLVKDALIKSLSNAEERGDPLCSPLFLPRFGPILFRPNPPDLFTPTLTLKDFQENPESRRLIECLSLYYVILQRDTKNMTRIRDKHVQQSIEHGLLHPLRSSVSQWIDGSDTSNIHDITPAVSIKICLERIDTALASLWE